LPAVNKVQVKVTRLNYSKNSLIQVVEVWTPDESGDKLQLNCGSYGAHQEFSQSRRELSYAAGENVPGHVWVWQSRSPLVVPDVQTTSLRDSEATRRAGFTSALAIPVVEGDKVRAVVLLLCDQSRGAQAAFEVWSRDDRDELGLTSDYYANLKQFSNISRHVKFPRGASLPGRVWEDGAPVIVNGLTAQNGFSRPNVTVVDGVQQPAEGGLDTAVGIPVMRGARMLDSVVLILSASKRPICRRFEVWKLDPATSSFALHESSTAISSDKVQTGDVVKQVCESRLPYVTTSEENGWSLGIPIFAGHEMSSIVTLTC